MKYEPRILWSIGQTLLPEHMQGMEDSLLSDVAVRSTLSGLPFHGYSGLVFGSALSTSGIVSLERGTLVTRLGRLIVVGENATIQSLNLNNSSKSTVDVFVHLLPPENRDDRRAEERSHLRAQHEITPRWKWRLHLSFDENVPGALEYMFLGRFSKGITAEWSHDVGLLPPILSLGGPGFLLEDIRQLAKYIENFTKTLCEEAADIQLSGENLIQVKSCLLEVRSFGAWVNNVLSEIKVHPFVFHQRLFNFYLAITSYRNVEPSFASATYQHDNLALCLLPLMKEVEALLQVTRNATPMVAFRNTSGTWSVGFDDQIVGAAKWFLLVQKQKVSDQVEMSNVKFASLPRLNVVHKYFLPGVPIQKVDRPVFQHYFGPEIDVYEFQMDEEWRQAILDRSLAFVDESRFEELRFHLYWSKI